MVLWKTILVLLLVYYLFKILFRFFGPKLMAYAARKTQERFFGQFDGFQKDRSQDAHVGDTVIEKNPQKKKASSKKVGEYIDFEEIG